MSWIVQKSMTYCAAFAISLQGTVLDSTFELSGKVPDIVSVLDWGKKRDETYPKHDRPREDSFPFHKTSSGKNFYPLCSPRPLFCSSDLHSPCIFRSSHEPEISNSCYEE